MGLLLRTRSSPKPHGTRTLLASHGCVLYDTALLLRVLPLYSLVCVLLSERTQPTRHGDAAPAPRRVRIRRRLAGGRRPRSAGRAIASRHQRCAESGLVLRRRNCVRAASRDRAKTTFCSLHANIIHLILLLRVASLFVCLSSSLRRDERLGKGRRQREQARWPRARERDARAARRGCQAGRSGRQFRG